MSFGRTTSPPATPKQVQFLLALVQKEGHDGFRDARGPLGLTQRQAAGKFTRAEASALIDQLANGEAPDGAHTGESLSAAERLEAEREQVLRGMPAGLLAAELERRGWSVTPPA
jgi:hypothetical protein